MVSILLHYGDASPAWRKPESRTAAYRPILGGKRSSDPRRRRSDMGPSHSPPNKLRRLCDALYTGKKFLLKPTSWHELVLIRYKLLLLILAGFITYYASIDGCRHLVYLTPTQRELALKYNWITQPWGIFGFATGKVSVALLLLRIIGPSTIWRKWILYITMVSVTTINILGCIFTFAQCNPPRALWTPHLVDTGQAACWDPRVQSNYAIFLSSTLSSVFCVT